MRTLQSWSKGGVTVTFEEDGDAASSASRRELLQSPEHWPLFYETAKNMEIQQLVGVLERQSRHLIFPRLPLDFDARYEARVPENPSASADPVREDTTRLQNALTSSRLSAYQRRLDSVSDGRLTFLQTTVAIESDDGVDWFHPELSGIAALWALKFHGFEFLRWAYLTADSPADCPEVHGVFKRWIRDWARDEETRIGTRQYLRRAWTPHSVSLRVLNLSRYYSWCVRTETDTTFLMLLRRLIFKNALFLENHVEYDIGGNHLIENAVALVTAGVLFERDGTSWLSEGIAVLEDASEQFLADGGHFERSPMYHAITLQRYLTTLSLLRERGEPWPEDVAETARRASRFLTSIRPPDGRIPLLNDAVYGEALELESCLEYARTVGISLADTSGQDAMQESGYYWLGQEEDRLLVDGGPFGPTHLPAHSHNDFFSICVWVDGKQLITDTGTFHYAPSSRRQYSRSVSSHNTVQVGNVEPIPLGGQYLAGKRLQPDVAFVQSEGYSLFDGAYRRRSSPEYGHRRRITGGADWWFIEDTVTDTGERPVTQRLHFHPAVDIGDHPTDSDGYCLSIDGEGLAYILPAGFDAIAQQTTPYFPAFHLERSRSTLVFEREAEGTMTFLLSKDPYSREEFRALVSSIDDTIPTVRENHPPR